MIFYYSGCGNSRMAAQLLADSLGEKLVFIPDAARAGEYEYTLGASASGVPDSVSDTGIPDSAPGIPDSAPGLPDSAPGLPESAPGLLASSAPDTSGEMLGFVWPVYCWAPPKLVLDFISKLRINGMPSHCWCVCTCGDTAGHTEAVFRKALRKVRSDSAPHSSCSATSAGITRQKTGLELDAIYSVIMPETYINLKGMMLDTPERAAEKVAAAKLRLSEIAGSLKAHRRESQMILGPRPWLNTYIVRPIFYAFLVKDSYFTVSDACIGCGKCAEGCPLKNISMVPAVQPSGAAGKLRPHWNGNCTTCEACYHNCPVNAIQFGKATAGKGQYHGPGSL